MERTSDDGRARHPGRPVVWWWIGLAIAFVVVLAVMVWLARRVRSVEDDSSYLTEEQPFQPFGTKFVDILRGRRDSR